MISLLADRSLQDFCPSAGERKWAGVQGTVTDGKLADLNNRIQATAAQPSTAQKAWPPATKFISAVARPVAPLSLAQHSAPIPLVLESPRPAALVMSHGMLQLQCDSGDDRSQRIVRCVPSYTAAHGGSAVQLVKLSGTVSIGM